MCICALPPTLPVATTFGKGGGKEDFSEPGLCEDYHPQCVEWASHGECTKNQGFMVRASVKEGV